jgi:murein DD-endopeptidase MepM/ murein hydrolase activator NlpD
MAGPFSLDRIGSLPTPGASGSAESAAAERQKATQLAHEFEAMMLLQMIRQMRQTMKDPDESDQPMGLGADAMLDTIDVEVARRLSYTGGFGLADRLLAGLGRDEATAKGTTQTTAQTPSQVPTLTPVLMPVSPATLPVATTAPVAGVEERELADAPRTSPFGWRRDPFGGMAQFHQGVDIAAAYGREVPAAGSGRVVFAGEQGGYGTTVVIEHEPGVTTRYAHLSALHVQAGDQVAAGAAIGRVGTSGRSTGAHLHFELLVGGRPVDPESTGVQEAGLKFLQPDADLAHSQSSGQRVAAGAHHED